MVSVMRKLLAGAALFALTAATPSFAADLALKSPANIPVFSWTGCHLGADVGGAFSHDKIRSSGDFSSVGVVGGGQIGCDYEFASAWTIGIEGRANWSSLKSSTAGRAAFPAGLIVPTQFTLSNEFLASATARAGYSFVDRWLVYVRGGAAWTREKADHAFTVPVGGIIFPSVPTAPLAVDPSGT